MEGEETGGEAEETFEAQQNENKELGDVELVPPPKLSQKMTEEKRSVESAGLVAPTKLSSTGAPESEIFKTYDDGLGENPKSR